MTDLYIQIQETKPYLYLIVHCCGNYQQQCPSVPSSPIIWAHSMNFLNLYEVSYKHQEPFFLLPSPCLSSCSSYSKMALALSVELYRASDKAHELQRNRPEIKQAASATKQSQFTIRQLHNEFNKKERIIFKIGSIKSESTDLKSNLNCTKKNKKSKKTNLKKQQIFCFFSSLVFFFFSRRQFLRMREAYYFFIYY